MRNLLRSILVTLSIVGIVVAAACAPAAAPSPTAAPPKAAATTAPATKPAEATPSAAKPVATTAPTPAAKPTQAASAKPAASADWKAEWDKMVAAANKEGKVIVDGPPGDLYRQTAMAFEKAFPEIKVEFTGADGMVFSPKLKAERDAGQYLWDVYLGGATTALTQFIPNGVLDPLKPALILPEVLDNSKWVGGLDNLWMDKEGQYIFGFEAGLQHTIFVNRQLAPESQLSNHDQLLDPKWKGKIVSYDLRTPGAQNGSSSRLLKVKGEDWLRKFYSQDITLLTDERAVIESLVRGGHAIAVGFKPAAFQVFRHEGLADHVLPLDPDSEAGAGFSTGASHATLINKAPHPNAAKVFVNWLLSREGQQVFVGLTDLISPRLDVEGGDAFFRPKPNVKYSPLNNELMVPYKNKAMEIAKEIFK